MTKINRVLWGAFLTFIAGAITLGVAAKKWDYILPSTGAKTTLKIKGKSWTYWRLDAKNPATLKVTGPTKIKVYTRAALPKGERETLYGIVVERDKEKRSLIGRATSHSKAVVNPRDSKQKLGAPRTLYFTVPSGTHEFSFKLPSDAKEPVFARFFVENGKKSETNYIAFLPRKFSDEAKIAIREQEFIYYRTNSSASVELEVIGPAKIKGVARLEFDHTIRGEKQFRVQVKENDKIVLTKPFNGTISGTATLVGQPTKLVSKGETFYINVPSGKHRYLVTTPDANISVLFRFYIPDRALGNVLTPQSNSRTRTVNAPNTVQGG